MKHYKGDRGNIEIKDKELIELMEKDKVKENKEIVYNNNIYKAVKVGYSKVTWKEISICERCVWAKWMGKGYTCMFPNCVKSNIVILHKDKNSC